MKLVVTIPAFNEEKTIGKVIRNIPRDCCDEVEVLVIDDGSTDKTVERARENGADKIVTFKRNLGLATAFRKGIETALEMKADIIVNIDADGQYDPNEIPVIIQPILEGKADIVLGSRFLGNIEYMPIQKKLGNKLATKITSFLVGIPISDAQTGFRAFTKNAAMKIHVLSKYTYVQETIIQAVYKNLKILEVPCSFRKREGKSRLISNIFTYAIKAGLVIFKTYLDYKPLKVFLFLGGALFLVGLLFGARVLIDFLQTGGVHFLPSAILTAIFLIIGFQIVVLGLIAAMIGTNRRIMEDILYYQKKSRYK